MLAESESSRTLREHSRQIGPPRPSGSASATRSADENRSPGELKYAAEGTPSPRRRAESPAAVADVRPVKFLKIGSGQSNRGGNVQVARPHRRKLLFPQRRL